MVKSSRFLIIFSLLMTIPYFLYPMELLVLNQRSILPEKLHITTFQELEKKSLSESTQIEQFNSAQKGIKQVVIDQQDQKSVDTNIVVRNQKMKKDILYHVKTGMPEGSDKTIFLLSPDAPCSLMEGTFFERMEPCRTIGTSDGFSHDINLNLRGGVSAFFSYKQISYGLLNGTIVTFDAPFRQRKLVNGGLGPDVAVLKRVYYELIRKNPQAKIVLIGGCIGGTAILNLLAQEQLPQLAGVIVDAPPPSLVHAAERIAKVDFWFLPSRIAQYVVLAGIKSYLPSYKKHMHEGSILDAGKDLTMNNVPILFGRSDNDGMVATEHTEAMAQKFAASGNNNVFVFAGPSTIYHERSKKRIELKHGYLIKLPSYQYVVNSFCRHFNLPYDEELAQLGENLQQVQRNGFIDILPIPEERNRE